MPTTRSDKSDDIKVVHELAEGIDCMLSNLIAVQQCLYMEAACCHFNVIGITSFARLAAVFA